MVILLSIEESQSQIIGGFPEYVILASNVPSTIFYTLDGTEPNEDSEMFIDKINIPTTGLTTILKAVAISGAMSSAVLEETYFTDHSKLGKVRHIGKEGINILPAGSTIADNLSFNASGGLAQASSIPFVDLDVVASTTNRFGEDIPVDTTIDFIRFPIEKPLEPNPIPPISSPNNNVNFNPKAAYIVIDGSTKAALDNQVVRIINRPHGTIDLLSRINNQNMDEYQLTTSNFVRHMIDPRTGKVTFYYRDSRENRWIKSTQRVEGKGLNLAKAANMPNSLVFRWIEDRSQSKIY